MLDIDIYIFGILWGGKTDSSVYESLGRVKRAEGGIRSFRRYMYFTKTHAFM